MAALKLYMLMLGATPPGRHTEQHDIFFAIGESLKSLVPEINLFWPEAAGRLHIDAWREVTAVDGHQINVMHRAWETAEQSNKLFFINLGGYKQGLFDEPHFKIITVQENKAAAIKYSKETDFYRDVKFPGAESHVDDKFGLDVDDLHQIDDILPAHQKELYSLNITKATDIPADEIHLGYFKLNSL